MQFLEIYRDCGDIQEARGMGLKIDSILRSKIKYNENSIVGVAIQVLFGFTVHWNASCVLARASAVTRSWFVSVEVDCIYLG